MSTEATTPHPAPTNRPGKDTPVYVGLDVGTTNLKATAYDSIGRCVRQGHAPTPWQRSAMDPEVLWTACDRLLRQVVSSSTCAAIGVTGMAESGILLGADDESKHPIIAWHDPLGEPELTELKTVFGAGFTTTTGLRPSVRPSAIKARALLGGRDAPPGTRWLTVPEWIVHRAGGDSRCDWSLAARTGWLDLTTKQWVPELLAFSGLPEPPAPLPAGSPMGTALQSGYAGAVLTVAGNDHLCAAVGAAADQSAMVFDSWGTGEALLQKLSAEPTKSEIETLIGHGFSVGLFPDDAHPTAFRGLGSGIRLTEAMQRLGITHDDLVENRRVDCDGTWRSELMNVFADVAEALDDLARIVGPRVCLVAGGGWTQNAVLMALKRSVIGEFTICAATEPGTLGAAHLAARAAGSHLPRPTPIQGTP